MKARIPNQGPTGAAYMKQLQQLQENMQARQEELEQIEYTASSGGGAVNVSVSGAHEIKSIKINPDVVDPEDVEMLEDLLTAALNEAMKKADEATEAEMGKLTGGLNIPGF